ncbi:MAG: Clp protease ClpP [Rikenellaceae bacterium]
MKNSITIKNNSTMVAIIEIDGQIGAAPQSQHSQDASEAATYDGFMRKLEEIRELYCEHIRVNIRSSGGDLNDALLIYQALCDCPATVETHCYGYVASAATIIAQAASLGQRYVSSGSLYLIHNASMTLQGNQSEARRTAELLEKCDDQIAELYALRSGLPKEGFRELMNSEDGQGRWLTPQEAVGFALADQIEKPSPLAKIRRRVNNFLSTLTATSEVTMPKRSSEDRGAVVNSSGDYFISTDTYARRAKIHPTQTIECEDPPIFVEGAVRFASQNQRAYDQDLVHFQ